MAKLMRMSLDGQIRRLGCPLDRSGVRYRTEEPPPRFRGFLPREMPPLRRLVAAVAVQSSGSRCALSLAEEYVVSPCWASTFTTAGTLRVIGRPADVSLAGRRSDSRQHPIPLVCALAGIVIGHRRQRP